MPNDLYIDQMEVNGDVYELRDKEARKKLDELEKGSGNNGNGYTNAYTKEESDTRYVQKGNAYTKEEADGKYATKEELLESAGGISSEMKKAMANAIRNEIAFTSSAHPYTDAWLALLEDDTDDPVNPPIEKTLIGIAVTWSETSADVGVNPSTLILLVKANYSDGSSQTITGYTVSPSALVEGANTITVTYQGKTASKTITGNALQPIDTAPVLRADGKAFNNSTKAWVDNNDWTATEKYEYPIVAGQTKYINVYIGRADGQGRSTTLMNIQTYNGNDAVTETLSTYSSDNSMYKRSVSSANDITHVSFNLSAIGGANKSYAYDFETGNIIFAGIDSPYYGKRNISEV